MSQALRSVQLSYTVHAWDRIIEAANKAGMEPEDWIRKQVDNGLGYYEDDRRREELQAAAMERKRMLEGGRQ